MVRRNQKPESLRFWLLTTTRNALADVFRSQQRVEAVRERVSLEEQATGRLTYQAGYIERLTDDERRRAFMRAFKQLSELCRELLSLLLMDPPLEYSEIAASLDRPIGSIGPTRQRCVEKLRALVFA